MDFLEMIFDDIVAKMTIEMVSMLQLQPTLSDFNGLPDWIQHNVISKMNQSFIAKLYDIKGHYERVQFFLSHDEIKTEIEKSVKKLIFDGQGKGRKNLEKSKIFIEQAKKMMNEKNLDQALKLYNKGILSTPFPEDGTDFELKERLSSLLHERSNIYKLMQKWSEAWADAGDAVKYSPANSKSKKDLIKSRNNLLKFIKSKDVNLVPNPVFNTPDLKFDLYNDKLNGAASCLKMSYSNQENRGIVTTKKVKPDTILIAEEPFVHLLSPYERDSYCAHCLIPLNDRPFPCRGCDYLRFCSSECSEKAWETYHSKECSHITALTLISKGHIALRAFLTVGIDTALDIYCQSFKNKKTVDNNKMQNNFEDILTLLGYEDTRADGHMIVDIGCAVFISFYAQTIGLITNDRFIDFASLAFKFLSIDSINTYYILDDVYHDSFGNIRSRNHGDSPLIGIGLYATSSLLTNSCDQNCSGRFFGKKMITGVDKTIKRNQELTTCLATNQTKMRSNKI